MTANDYEIRVCENPACGLRYPLVKGHPFGTRCPLCLGSTQAILTRPLSPEPFSPPNAPRNWLHAVLDNVRSAWNVGAMFRTADGLGVEKLYLCGITPTPENDAVRKTSLGAEKSVQWEYARDAVKLAERLKAEGFALWGLEQDERAASLGKTDFGTDVEADKRMWTTDEADKRRSVTDVEADKRMWTTEEAEKRRSVTDVEANKRIWTTEEAEKRRSVTDVEADKRIWTTEEAEKRIRTTKAVDITYKQIVLVVGNEVTGVDPGVLDLCDRIVYIPMQGGKRSLNVEVAFAIAAWVVSGY